MNSIIFHEFKKIATNKLLIGIVFMLLFANAFNIYQSNDKFHDKFNIDSTEAQWCIYERLEGEITEEKINWLNSYIATLEPIVNGESEELPGYYFNAYGDLTFSVNFLDTIEKTQDYSNRIDNLIKTNNEQLNIYRQKNNEYLIKTAEYVSDTYSSREISSFYNVEAYDTYFDYNFSSFLILLIIFLFTASLYAGENEIGMTSLMRSTPRGRIELSNAKQTAMVLFIAVISALFLICDFLMFLWCLRLRGIQCPLYAIKSFEYTPLVISIGEFIVLNAMLKIVGFICFALISCVFSSILKKSYLVFSTDLIMCLCLMLLSVYSGGVLDYINLFNPINMLLNRDLFANFNVVNIFGTPIFKYIISYACIAFFVCILSAIVNLINNTNSTAKRCKR